MKINANPMASFNREVPAMKPPSRTASFEMPANTTETPKAAPPGLERVLAKFEAMGEGARTAGQSNAMSRIERNLARYMETQAMAGTPPTPTTEIPIEGVEAAEEALAPMVDAEPDTGSAPEMPTESPVVAEEPAVLAEAPAEDTSDPLLPLLTEPLAAPTSEASLLDALLAPVDPADPANPA